MAAIALGSSFLFHRLLGARPMAASDAKPLPLRSHEPAA